MSDIRDSISDLYEEALFIDGFDEAIIGISRRSQMNGVVTYDYDKCVRILMERDKIDYDESVEYIEYNIIGGWHGDQTPILVESSF
jgi:hypothetical protein